MLHSKWFWTFIRVRDVALLLRNLYPRRQTETACALKTRLQACVSKWYTEWNKRRCCELRVALFGGEMVENVTISTLCEKLKGPDFLPDAELQDLLQDVLPLGFLHDAHSFQLSVRQSHQSPPCTKKKKKNRWINKNKGKGWEARRSRIPVGIQYAQLEAL